MAGLVHASAIVIGTRGVLLIGPSGAGKSTLALRLMEGARLRGRFAGLVSDDQVILSVLHGRVIASGPESIRGLIELRGAGIGRFRTIDAAVIDFAVEPVNVDSGNRIPQDNRRWTASEGADLPLVTVDRTMLDPFATLESLFDAFAAGPRPLQVDDCPKTQFGA